MAGGEVLAEIVLDGDKQFRAAINKAGESMEDTGDEATGLSARLGRVAEGMSDLVAPATLAANRIDNVGDQMSQTGRKAATATAGIVGYSSASSGAAGASATWSAVMSASLIPALGALSLTLGPLVATLGAVAGGAGALAAAFGTVIGSGFLAYGRQLAATMPDVEKPAEALAKRFGELRTEIADIIAPLGQQFVPLIRDALNALPDLVRSIVNTLGPLDQFADTLRSMGQRAMDIIPQITAAVFRLARRALPVFQDFVSFIASRGPQAFDLLADSFRATRDEFAQLLGATVSALPPLLRLGNTVATILVPAVADAIGALGRAVSVFNDLPQPVRRGAVAAGLLGSAFVVAVPAVTAIAGAISALLGPLGAAVIAISALAGAWVADIGGMRAQTERVFNAISQEITATMTTLDAVTGGALSRAGETIRSFVTRARNNLDDVVRFIADTFIAGIRTLGRTVRSVLLRVSTLWASHGDTVKGIIRDLTNFITQNPAQALATLATVVVPGPLATIVAAFRDNWNQVKRTVRTALNTILSVARTTMQSFKNQIITPAQNSQTEFSRNINQMLTEGRQTFRMIRDVVSRVMSVVLTNIRTTLTDMRQVWKANLSGSDGILANARTAFNSLWTNIIRPTLNAIQSFWKTWGDDIIAVTRGIFDAVLTALTIFTDAMLTTLNVTLDLISGDWKGAWNNIDDFFQRTWSRMVDWFKNSGKSALLSALDLIIAGLQNAFTGFYDWLIGNSFFPDMINDVADYLKSTGKSLIKGAFDAIVGGIESALGNIDLSDITNAIQNIIDAASDAIDTVEAIPNNVSTTITQTVNKVVNGPDDDGDDDDDDGGGSSNPGAGRSSDDGGTSGTSGEGDDDGSNNSFAGYTDDADTGGDSSGSDLYGGSDAPGLAHGGLTQGEGLAYLHPSEVVMGVEAGAEALADELSAGGEAVTIEEGAIQIDAPGADADEVVQMLDKRLERLLTR